MRTTNPVAILSRRPYSRSKSRLRSRSCIVFHTEEVNSLFVIFPSVPVPSILLFFFFSLCLNNVNTYLLAVYSRISSSVVHAVVVIIVVGVVGVQKCSRIDQKAFRGIPFLPRYCRTTHSSAAVDHRQHYFYISVVLSP